MWVEIKKEQKEFLSPTDEARLKSYVGVEPHVQADLTMYEVLSRVTAIKEMKEKDEMDIQLFGLSEYIRGWLDGNRFMKKPNENLIEYKQPV